MTSDEYLYPPEDIQNLDDPLAAQKIQYTFDVLFGQLRTLKAAIDAIDSGSGTGGSGPHHMLSATHTDSTAAAEVDGDLIVGSGGTWRRLPKGPDGSALVIDVGGAPIWSATMPAGHYHNLLSTPHPDTDPASPILGDMVVAQDTGATADTLAHWIDGEPWDVLPTTGDLGGAAYWLDGGAFESLASSGTVLWRRKANGTSGYVWTAGPSGPDWQPAGGTTGGSSSAAAYRSSDFTLADTTPTAVTLQATIFDNGGFWSAAAPTRLTVPTGQGGTYIVTGSFALDSGYAGISYAFIYVNGVLKATGQTGGVNATAPFIDPASVTAILRLNSGDYVELYAEIRNNVVGATFTVKGGATNTALELGRLVSESTIATGLPSVAAGALLRGNSAGTQWERLGIGAAGTVLLSSGTLPDWSTRPTLRDVAESISGIFDFTNGLKEHSRAQLLGEWISPAYAAGDFTGSGGMTWTVDVGDVLTFEYTLIGKTMIVVFALGTTSVTAPVGTDLQIKIPAAQVSAKTVVGGTLRVSDNGSVGELGVCVVAAGGTNILLRRSPLIAVPNWTAAVNNTTVQGIVAFEVQ
jgi:hypothetical protein